MDGDEQLTQVSLKQGRIHQGDITLARFQAEILYGQTLEIQRQTNRAVANRWFAAGPGAFRPGRPVPSTAGVISRPGTVTIPAFMWLVSY